MATKHHLLPHPIILALIGVTCFLIGGAIGTHFTPTPSDPEPPCVQVAAADDRGLPECGESL